MLRRTSRSLSRRQAGNQLKSVSLEVPCFTASYGFLKRLMMKKIVSDKPGGLSTDTSRDHVYTDWDEVERFAEAFLERLVREDATQLKT